MFINLLINLFVMFVEFLVICFKFDCLLGYLWVWLVQVYKFEGWLLLGSVVEVYDVCGCFVGCGFWNGYVCIVLWLLFNDVVEIIDVEWIVVKIVCVV